MVDKVQMIGTADLKILGLEERLRTQMSYRFGSHSEKSFEQWLPLFDELDGLP